MTFVPFHKRRLRTESGTESDGRFRRRRNRGGRVTESAADRGIISDYEWRHSKIAVPMRIVLVLLWVALFIAGIGPLLWLVKSAITPTIDILEQPLALWPHGFDWANLAHAWSQAHMDLAFMNTVWVTAGTWGVAIFIATTAGFGLSVLRPRFGPVLYGAVLATLFVPAVVLLIPLYLTIIRVPLVNLSLLNTYWAVWLPAGVNSFNVLLMKRFFDSLPSELFEAAKVDGAGAFRVFWSIVLPLSKPIISVVSIFVIIASLKDYLWPLLVLNNSSVQPLSVAIPAIESTVTVGTLMGALAIGALIPVLVFIVFQRSVLRGAGLGGALKG